MSYLLQYARRPARRSAAARVDEYMRLNRQVFTATRTCASRRGHGAVAARDPQLLQIADCVNTINLEFSTRPQLRENSLFKIDGRSLRFREAAAEPLASASRLARGRSATLAEHDPTN